MVTKKKKKTKATKKNAPSQKVAASKKKTTKKKSKLGSSYMNEKVKAIDKISTKRHSSPTDKLSPRQALIRSKRIYNNDAKRRIAKDMLERYTGHQFEDFQPQIILTNFHYYVERFNALLEDHIYTTGSAFKASSSKKAKVTIIEFGIGSAMAALIMELVAVTEPRAALFLGMCGAVHPSLKVGDFILPIGAIRAESVTQNFMPTQVPALPTFKVQKFCSQILVENGFDYRTGTVHSTDLRFWEFDPQFKENLYEERVLAVEMECAALFVTGFASKVSIGALLLVSDTPLKRNGIKTKKSASKVFKNFTDVHIELGIETMADIADRGDKIRHYRW